MHLRIADPHSKKALHLSCIEWSKTYFCSAFGIIRDFTKQSYNDLCYYRIEELQTAISSNLYIIPLRLLVWKSLRRTFYIPYSTLFRCNNAKEICGRHRSGAIVYKYPCALLSTNTKKQWDYLYGPCLIVIFYSFNTMLQSKLVVLNNNFNLICK